MRAFIALELPVDFASDVAAVARQLQGSVKGRFMHRATYHLTLAFLGDVDESQAAAASDALASACTGRAPVPVASDGLGIFGSPRDATLWLGVAPAAGLVDLAAAVRDELARRDVPFDAKPFKPHVTLARRARVPRGALPALVFPRDDEAADVTLFKSLLSSEGASYKPLSTVRLRSGGSQGTAPSSSG